MSAIIAHTGSRERVEDHWPRACARRQFQWLDLVGDRSVSGKSWSEAYARCEGNIDSVYCDRRFTPTIYYAHATVPGTGVIVADHFVYVIEYLGRECVPLGGPPQNIESGGQSAALPPPYRCVLMAFVDARSGRGLFAMEFAA
jgi:hypothetical protein